MRNIFFALFGLSFFALFGAPANARPSKAAICLEGQSTIIHLIKERFEDPEVISAEAIERLVRKHNRHCLPLKLAELELLAAQELTERNEKQFEELNSFFKLQAQARAEAQKQTQLKAEALAQAAAKAKALRKALLKSCDYTMSFSISANNAEIERLKGVAKELAAKGKNPLRCVNSLNKAMAHQARLIFNLTSKGGK